MVRGVGARHGRWILAGAVVIVVVGLGLLVRARVLAAQDAARQGDLRQARVTRGDVLATVSASGAIAPRKQAGLFFTGTGPVAAVFVQPGDAVRAGDPLAALDPTDLEIAVRQAEDALEIQRLTLEVLTRGASPEDLATARAEWLSAQAALGDLQRGKGPQEAEIAKLDYDRAKDATRLAFEQLYNLENAKFPDGRPIPIPEATVQLARVQAETAANAEEVARLKYEQAKGAPGQADLSVAYRRIAYSRAVLDQLGAGPTSHAIARAEAAVAQAEIALRLAQHQLDQATLRAPFDGVVGAVNARVGQSLGTDPAVTLVDDSAFLLDVSVDEADIARVADGQTLALQLDALPDARLTGRVDRLGPAASDVGGVITFPVRLTIDPYDREAIPLRGGMTATASIVVAEAVDVLIVPNWALRRDRASGDILLSLLRDGGLVEVPVTVGLRDEQFTQITAGVSEGEVVAVRTGIEGGGFFGGQ